ncbi:MAG: hypothetical protein JWN76_1576 [Chitinophagaceae bacterium]|nr:hypothetical protein [Chitinophagaceae bacterium]
MLEIMFVLFFFRVIKLLLEIESQKISIFQICKQFANIF